MEEEAPSSRDLGDLFGMCKRVLHTRIKKHEIMKSVK